jgi:CubicO group peptidase (beta-lactamase class C family)
MEDSTVEEDIFGQPLVNQPGEKWEYGVNMDWVGRLVERVSGLTLDEYFHEHIFKPLNMSSPCFFPQADQKKKLAFLHQRNSDGTIAARENGHLLHRPLSSLTPKEAKGIPQSGGAGLFSVVSDYCGISTFYCK